ncbi:MAG: SCO1664 family protein [Lysobacterales bacterium]|nr:MAG: SCO1664 family protein [Xanthomonadales bacterium]
MDFLPRSDPNQTVDNPGDHTPEILNLLKHGSIKAVGQVVWGSNYTFLVSVNEGESAVQAIYKPARGERPLWDFPHGSLVEREAAAYLVSEALSWGLVPPTILRQDGPAGPGSLQLYIEANPEEHYFTFDKTQKQRLRPLALFDILVNNADRKGGHILVDGNGVLWSIDHGVCFHVEPKLRTVVWDFIGEPIPGNLVSDIQNVYDQLTPGSSLTDQLANLLDESEIEALKQRATALLREPKYPIPGPGRPYPWPLV